jgi:drug/metabolite transporter (DMT)-like permease
MTTAEPKDYLQLHFIVLLWSFTAIIGKLISIPAVELVFHRTLMAFVALALIMYLRKQNFAIGGKEILKIILTGTLIAAHWILFFAAARVANVSVCLAGMATCSLWTSLLEPLMMRRKLSIVEVILGMLVIFGLYVIFRFEFDHALGLSMAVVSALLAAIFSIMNAKFTIRHNPYMITCYEMLGAFIGTAAFLPFYASAGLAEGGELRLIPANMDWVYIAILALVCTVYAYSVAVDLMKRFTAFAMNLTVNLEPVYGIVLAVLIFGKSEEMTPGFYAGTLIILFAVLAHPVINKIRKRRPITTRVVD